MAFYGARAEEHALCVTDEMRLIRVLALSRMLLEALDDDRADYPIDSDRLKADLQVLVDHADEQLAASPSQHRLRAIADGK